ncbi:AraC-like DNA-binding protein [Saccharomonospora amisosensis]|uniref:AraC-like DNA-binding protein n=1 Tax=Saccharomonospora amisosensis TaxID=1128677 RepID=A0A7X5ZRN0_9PSEU|nr:AraC family transcriptional regulator [Saccharomonospora amisosensis]NIJ13044.1 AraC-like DNA-binding protein [Saccharomonospora amisosensis]
MKSEPLSLHTEGYSTEHVSDDRIAAVLRSVRSMRENIGDEHSLRNLAQSALLSPYHFHRVFRQVTASTPARFVAACRMEEAKLLLANSSDNVTDICMQVGYSSLGTFTSQFSRLVGMSPRRFRRLMSTFSADSCADVLAACGPTVSPPERTQVTGVIDGDSDCGPLAVVGLFPSGIPQESPAACAVVRVSGVVAFDGLPDGTYYPLAVSFRSSATVADSIGDASVDHCLIGVSSARVRISGGRAVNRDSFPLRLRRRRPIDPPLVLALPLLLAAGRPNAAA